MSPERLRELELEAEAEAEAEAEVARAAGSLAAKVKLPELYPLQEQIKAEAGRFNVVCIGRRAGKTYLCTHLALETVLQGQPVGWFVPDYKVAADVWREVSRVLKPVATKLNATERRIELSNGGVLDVWTLENEDAGRGRKYKRVVIDEAAMSSNLKDAWENAIRPTLTDLRGDAWFPSTPKGLNHFYHLFQRGLDPLQAEWKSWQMPSAVNPYLPVGEVEAAREELPAQAFKQEYLAEFLQDEGAVFRNVEACLVGGGERPEQHRGHVVVAGVDWARKHDFTVVSVFCCNCRREVAMDRFNQIGWAMQRERIGAMITRWRVVDTVVETNSIGSPNLEQLQREMPEILGREKGFSPFIRGFETTMKSKAPLIQALALCFEREQAKWLDDAVAKHELVAYEATITESGYTKYSAPEGQWDDTVIARALAWEAGRRRIPVALTMKQQMEQALPVGWREEDLRGLTPWERDRVEAARREAYEELEDQLEAKRRPRGNGLWEGGNARELI